jgi:hypothetical protein
MIEVAGVRQTPHEMRSVTGAWPPVRIWGYVGRSWLGLLCLTMIAASWWFAGATITLWIEGFALALLFGSLALGLAATHHIARIAKSTPLGDAVSAWRLDDTGVRITYPLGEQSLDWRAIVRVVEEKDRLIFAVTPARNHVLPLRCFDPGQLDAFRALIAEARASGRLGGGVDYRPPASDKA